MSDTAQNSNTHVNDIWSLPDPPQDDANTTQKPSSGSFGKPGLAGGGENGGGWESDNAAQEVEHTAEIFKTPEVPVSPEVGEKEKPEEVHEPKRTPKAEPPEVVQEISTKGKIIDKRTGKEKTHRVDPNKADKVTKIADIKEQDFIEGVELVHTIV